MTNLIWLLAAITVVLYIWGYLFAIKMEPDNPDVRLPLQVRVALSFLLLIAAILISQAAPGIYAFWVLLGMAFSTLGDLFMARIIPLPNRLYGGIGAFTIAHIFYVTAFILTLSDKGYELGSLFWQSLFIYSLLNAVVFIFLIRNPKGKLYKEIGLLFLAYILWIGAMAAFAFTLAVNLGGVSYVTAFGAFSFVISDLMIGITVIGERKFPRSELWVWLTYVLGQMCIIYAGLLLIN